MQLLESSILGLRTARHVFAQRGGAVTVTLFPMVHLGDPDFFETVYADAGDHDAVLLEGIRSPVTRRLTRAYRWLDGGLGGLTVQPPFPDGANLRAERLHADLPPEVFDSHWRAAHRPTRWLITAAAPAYALWLRATATRDSLAKALAIDDLPDRASLLAWSPEFAGLDRAVIDLRDTALIEALAGVLDRTDPPTQIAVAYGAQHMRAVIRFLDARGFAPTGSRWLTVFHA